MKRALAATPSTAGTPPPAGPLTYPSPSSSSEGAWPCGGVAPERWAGPGTQPGRGQWGRDVSVAGDKGGPRISVTGVAWAAAVPTAQSQPRYRAAVRLIPDVLLPPSGLVLQRTLLASPAEGRCAHAPGGRLWTTRTRLARFKREGGMNRKRPPRESRWASTSLVRRGRVPVRHLATWVGPARHLESPPLASQPGDRFTRPLPLHPHAHPRREGRRPDRPCTGLHVLAGVRARDTDSSVRAMPCSPRPLCFLPPRRA